MSDRLQQIREAVKRDVSNCETAYADRAWLLGEYDRQREALVAIQKTSWSDAPCEDIEDAHTDLRTIQRIATAALASQGNTEPGMRPEYDFTNGVRGKYAGNTEPGKPVHLCGCSPGHCYADRGMRYGVTCQNEARQGHTERTVGE